MTGQAVIHDAASGRWLDFREPRRVIEAGRVEDVVPALRRVESIVEGEGLHAVGFIAYEAAPAFDAALRVRPPGPFPLLWFGLYPPPGEFALPPPPPIPAKPRLRWTPSVSRAEYDRAIAAIREYIARGETYQTNYTFRLNARFAGDPWMLFLKLSHAQQSDYAAYVDTGRYAVCSASPELFFLRDGDRLTSRPMKGTVGRGLTLADDEARARWLARSGKNRAENVMILDMVRNDMGRIAVTGGVRVGGMFDVEKYPTVWQMTSTVDATTGASLCEVMAALFPCASITGAPKVRTMRIIAGIETTPRRIYTGCIGHIAPGRAAQFNVAIRTVLVDRKTGRAEYGVGGGIMWDSDSGDEYEECRVKARVLTEKRPAFSLLETILWSPGEGYFLLPIHLRRLRDSARYFDYAADIDQVKERLGELAGTLSPRPHKVRLLVERDGTVLCEASVLGGEGGRAPVRLRPASAPVDSRDPFLYHKTTNRRVYDEARAAWPGCDDVVLWNERGEVTETSIANIVVRSGGRLVTPPVRCGLLPGTFRARLLDRGRVREEVVKIGDLDRVDGVYIVNSVHGWRKAVVIPG